MAAVPRYLTAAHPPTRTHLCRVPQAEAKSMDIPLRLITELKALRDEALAMEDLRLAGEKGEGLWK